MERVVHIAIKHGENTMNKNKEELKDWVETIHKIIVDSFSYYGYLQGLKDYFEEKKEISIPCLEFVNHLKYLLQTSICLNLTKLFFDNSKDVYNFNRYKKKIEETLSIQLKIKKHKFETTIENNVYNFRKRYIAHSIENSPSISISLEKLFEMLKIANNYFNDLTPIEYLEKSRRIDDKYIQNIVNHFKAGFWDFILLHSDNC